MLFQLMFAAFTPALIAGAFAERIKFGADAAVCRAVVGICLYVPLPHWMWGGGWLARLGAHRILPGERWCISVPGSARWPARSSLGKRRGWRTEYMAPHNLPFVLLGTGMLWLGWFGFNGGSARGANAVAVGAVTVTHLAAVSAALAWMVVGMEASRKTDGPRASRAARSPGLATSTAGSRLYRPVEPPLCRAWRQEFAPISQLFGRGRSAMMTRLMSMGTHGVGGIARHAGGRTCASQAVNPGGPTVCSSAMPTIRHSSGGHRGLSSFRSLAPMSF